MTIKGGRRNSAAQAFLRPAMKRPNLRVITGALATRVVVGTSLLQILIVTAFTTMVHALTTQAVDIVLAGLLLIGGVIGAQFGARLAAKLQPQKLRMLLAVIVLAVALRMLLGLSFRPSDVFSIDMLP